jgi:hypothetical protein
MGMKLSSSQRPDASLHAALLEPRREFDLASALYTAVVEPSELRFWHVSRITNKYTLVCHQREIRTFKVCFLSLGKMA